MASASKILPLYLTLIDPTIKTNIIEFPIEISSNHLLQTLSMINKETFTLDSKIAMFATHSIRPKDKSHNKKYTPIQERYVQHKTLTETVLHNAKTQQNVMEIPNDAIVTPFLHKKLILISSIKTNTLFIYDIKKKKKYYLPTTSLQGCRQFQISPDENYIATFSRTHSHKEYDESLIYLWDISDIENIKYHKPLYHRNVSILAFNPNGKTLISGANNNTVELWNLEELSDEDILSKPLLMNDTIDEILFNNDGTTLAIRYSSDTFTHFITLIDTATLQKQMLFALKKQPCAIFPNNSNVIMYSTYDEEHNQFMFKITTEKNKELYTKELPRKDMGYEYYYIISDNNKYIAINFSDQQKFDLLTINSDLNVNTITINGECDYINNDGSFYTHTSHAINLYNTTAKRCTTLYHAPQQLITAVDIMPNKKCMTYSYYTDNKKTKLRAYKKLLNEEEHKNLKLATKSITPLQYMLINKVCNETRKHKEHISIPQDSLNHHIVQSFDEHKELITKKLNLQITDK